MIRLIGICRKCSTEIKKGEIVTFYSNYECRNTYCQLCDDSESEGTIPVEITEFLPSGFSGVVKGGYKDFPVLNLI
jgi:hypothetical protein